jgi:hypothetical protein
MASQKGNGESKIHLPQHRKDEHIAEPKYCPVCPQESSKNFPMFKKDDCDHMTCEQCGTHFCWGCLSVFDDTQICTIKSIIWNCLDDCNESSLDRYLDTYSLSTDGCYDNYSYNN